ncbi:MAG: hypothetical protein EOO43_00595 [Flavobacterium sp.]|nr:MAG: hypothetical protein EOO43_00595 [Flavobacterium sp.]
MSAIKLRASLVKPHFSLKQKQETKNVVDFILDELKHLDISSLKLDPDFLKYLAEVIENQVSKPKDDSDKPDKMGIMVELLRKLFPHIADEQIEQCKGIIEYLLKNDMVKKVKLSKVLAFYLKKKFF